MLTTWMLARRVGSVCVIGMMITAGCSGSDRPEGRVTVRDSAGVTVVESTAPAWAEGAGWHVGDTPSVDIGGRADESAYDLFQVFGALRLTDGRLVIADGSTQQLRFYAPDGAHLHTVGGIGEGPGEFTGMGLLVSAPGDTLLAFDFRQLRISRFDPDGSFLDAHSLAGIERATLQMVGVLDDGTVLSRSGGAFAPGSKPSGLGRDSTLYVFHQLPLTHVDTLGWFPGSETFTKSTEKGVSVRTLPFGKHTTVAAHGTRVFVGTADAYEIMVFDENGALQMDIRRPHQPIPVSADMINTYKRSQRDNAAVQGQMAPNFRAMFDAMLEEMPYPDVHPSYQEITSDRAGNLWVLDPIVLGNGARTYHVFDTTGSWLGPVKMPMQFKPTDIGSNYVLGIGWDEDLVEHVQLYPLLRP